SRLSQDHGADDGLDKPKRADGVYLKDSFKVLAISIWNQSQRDGPKVARIVDQNIYRPNQSRRLTHNRINTLFIADVSHNSESAPATAADLADTLVEFRFLPGDAPSSCPSCREVKRHAPSQPPAPAGDEHRFLIQVVHLDSLLFSRRHHTHCSLICHRN